MSVETLDNDFVTQLGLTRAPFVAGEAVSANFVSPIREGQLQKAAHQIRYGELMMVVVGTKGSGKTFFLDKLELDLVDLPQIIRLDIGADTSPEAFLLSILAGLRPQAILEQPQPIGALLASIRAVLAQCSEPPVLILDNAGQLADKELAMLLSLIASVGGAVAMKTVMAGDQALVSRLDNLNTLEVMIYDLELAPVSVEQWLDYCKQELLACGYTQPLPFTLEELTAVVARADGNIGEVFDLLLGELNSKTVEPAERKAAIGLPPTHMIAVLALIACLVLVVMAGERLWSGDDDAPAEGQLPEPVSVLEEPAVVATESEVEPAPNPVTSTDVVAEPVVESSPPEIPKTEAATTETSEVEPQESQAVLESAAEIVQEEVAQAPVSQSQGTVIASPEVSVGGTEPERSVVEPSAPSSVLDGLAEDHYVLQIMAAQSAAALEKFKALQSNGETLRIANVKRSGGDWYVLLQGDYSDAGAARAGIARLPKSQQKDGVWPRKVEDLKRILVEDN